MQIITNIDTCRIFIGLFASAVNVSISLARYSDGLISSIYGVDITTRLNSAYRTASFLAMKTANCLFMSAHVTTLARNSLIGLQIV